MKDTMPEISFERSMNHNYMILSKCSYFGNDDGGNGVFFRSLHQRMDVVLRDVLSGEDHRGVLPLLAQKPERIAHRFEHRLGAQVGTTDADADDQIGLGAELGCGGFDGREIGAEIDDGRCTHPRKSLPAPLPEWSSALAACALAFMSAVTSMPDLRMSRVKVFISCQINLGISSFMLRRGDAPW